MGEQQHEGMAPLLEPAVLVADNCERCRGTAFVVKVGAPDGLVSQEPWAGRDPLASDVPKNTEPCPDCNGQGRTLREVPLSEFVQMAGAVMQRFQAPSPSELRRGA